VLQNSPGVVQFHDAGMVLSIKAFEFIPNMQPHLVETPLAARFGGAKTVVILVVFFPGKSGRDIGAGKWQVAALNIVEDDCQGPWHLVIGWPLTDFYWLVAVEAFSPASSMVPGQ
jgi:hypothetical protein